VGVARIWPEGLESEAVELGEGTAMTFGRTGDLIIDPDNRYLHRSLGTVSEVGGSWRLANVGSRVVLHVRKPTSPRVVELDPEAETELPSGISVVSFAAGRATYAVCIEVPGASSSERPAPEPASGLLTALPGAGVALTPAQKLLLVVMCEPKLRALGRSDWTVPGNEELARRLLISPKTVEKHVAEVCRRLADDGVLGLHAQAGQPVAERRRILVEAAVGSQLVTLADLA
jgi:hypothetical protein